MKLFQVVFENEYNDLSDEELILLNRANKLSGIPYFALQNVLSKRGLTTYRIIEIDRKAFNKDNKWLNVKEKYKNMLVHLYSYRDLSFLFNYFRNLSAHEQRHDHSRAQSIAR